MRRAALLFVAVRCAADDLDANYDRAFPVCPATDTEGGIATCGSPPFESCDAGARWYEVWRAFDARTATVDGTSLKRLKVQHRSLDSSLVGAFHALGNVLVHGELGIGKYEDPLMGCPAPWAAEATKCVLKLSPFGEACVRVAPRPQVLGHVGSASVAFGAANTRRDLRVAALVASILLHQTAPTIEESAVLHYGVGVSFGVLFGAVLLVYGALCVMISSPAKRRSAVALSFLGYSAAVMRHARRVVWSLVTSYPRLIATYACVAMAFSVLGTRAARSTDIFFDGVRCAVRVAATVLAFHATRSVAVGMLFAGGFAVAQLVSGSSLGIVWSVVASKLPASPDVKPSPRPDCMLAGHRYLTEEEYAQQASDATAEALAGLVETDEYRAWVAKNHHRLGARVEPPDDEGDDGSDY